MNKKIENKENVLFSKWKKHLKESDLCCTRDISDLFCPDGLHHTGSVNQYDLSNHREMLRDYKEESLWKSSAIRSIFLFKEYNQGTDKEGSDIRNETGLINGTHCEINKPLHKNWLPLLYALYNIDLKTGEFPSFEESFEKCISAYHKDIPVVRLNMKKIAGGGKCDSDRFREFVEHDEDYINNQIDMYHGNIIVCCDGSSAKPETGQGNPVMELLHRRYPDLECLEGVTSNNIIYYSRNAKNIVIHSWHFSKPDWDMKSKDYFEILVHLKHFIQTEPNLALQIFKINKDWYE